MFFARRGPRRKSALPAEPDAAADAVLASDRTEQLAAAAHGRDSRRLRDAVDRCEDVRSSLELNVSEDLALTALSVRLEQLVGSSG